MSFSRVLPNLPMLQGQYEGFAYLGVGMLALVLMMIADTLHKRRLCGASGEWQPLAIIALVTLAFAASTVLAIGSWTILDAPIKGPVLGAFRSSGRFIWIAYYVLILLAARHVLDRFRTLAGVVLAVVLILQMIDLSGAHVRTAGLRLRADAQVPETRLDDPRWEQLAATRSHMTLVPPSGCGNEAAPYLPFLLFAADHGMTLNSGYLARWNERATGRYCAALYRQIETGALNGDEIYIVGANWSERFHASSNARCERLNGYDVCVMDGATPP